MNINDKKSYSSISSAPLLPYPRSKPEGRG